jgi:hypothetical protein
LVDSVRIPHRAVPQKFTFRYRFCCLSACAGKVEECSASLRKHPKVGSLELPTPQSCWTKRASPKQPMNKRFTAARSTVPSLGPPRHRNHQRIVPPPGWNPPPPPLLG